MSLRPIRVGVVGLSVRRGWGNMALIPALKALKSKYELVAISNTTQESSTLAAKKYSQDLYGSDGDVQPYCETSSQKLVDRNDIDLFAIFVKSNKHLATAIPFIKTGKNIFLEWPAGRNLDETLKLAEAAAESGSRMYIGLQGRHSPVVKKIREIVASGQIGPIISTSVIGSAPRELKYWGPWISADSLQTSDPESGSSMGDIALGHFLDSFIHIFGDFSSIVSQNATHFKEAIIFDSEGNQTNKTTPQLGPDQIAFPALTKSGIMVNLHFRGGISSKDGQTIFMWLIDGENGCIRLENNTAPPGAFLNIMNPKVFVNGEEVKIDPDPLGNFGREWDDMAIGECATVEDAIKVRKVLRAIERSAQEGSRYDFD